MEWLRVALLLFGVVFNTSEGASGTNPTDAPPTDCIQALFQQAGVRGSHVHRFVHTFRRNQLDQQVLYDLSFLDLVKLLQGPSFNLTHPGDAGDTYRIHACVSNRGLCVVQPFCVNAGACVYSETTSDHRCDCPAEYQGATCETRIQDRLEIVADSLERLSRVVERVGVTYTRWGKETCNATTGAELVYTGQVAGQEHAQGGGGSNYLCLPFEPEYGAYQSGRQGHGRLHGSEFETNGFPRPFGALQDQNPTCSVCHVSGRSSQLMIPARKTCPSSWTLEYQGYLMSEYYNHPGRTEFICVDGNPDVLRGEHASTNGVLLYFVEVSCAHGIDCPPFDENKELTCAVCSR